MNWLLDAYRTNGKIVLWVKTKDDNLRIEKPFKVPIYIDPYWEKFLQRNKLPYHLVEKLTYLRKWKKVCEVSVDIMQYESFIRLLEKKTKHAITLYNADIAPEQQFLYQYKLSPGDCINDDLKPINGPEISLTSLKIDVITKNNIIIKIVVGDNIIEGSEVEILTELINKFQKEDPDVILMDYAFSKLPLLDERIRTHNLKCNFHRWEDTPIQYKGGKSFFSYGQVSYKDFAIRLKGRFLVDTSSTIGSESDVDGILELCKLTGARFQQVASRSFGSVFQQSLIRLMYQKNFLIPHKEKPVDLPLSMADLLKGDRGGHTFDAKVGLHKDVAEIDFTSMFPWIIYNKNVSADTILFEKPPYSQVPGLPIRISHHHLGLVPEAIKPLLDKRMYYKSNPTSLNNSRAAALKMVLVTAYGYLRFREFKLGIATSHMAICAYAREIIMETAKLAESKGFEVVHGIIDSVYIKKKNISEKEVKDLCREIEQLVGIPISFEGIFKWVVFLPSINNPKRPLPSTYYGVFKNGNIKARGIEVRQKRSPQLIKYFQQRVLEEMAKCDSRKEIVSQVVNFCNVLREIKFDNLPADWFTHKVRISKDNYKHDLPQRKIVNKLKRQGAKVMPGLTIEYLMQKNRVVLPEEYNGQPDVPYYRKLLIRSLFILLQPFGVTKNQLEELSGSQRQYKITDFTPDKIIKYKMFEIYRSYVTNRGLSERQIRKKLEKDGWHIWRGGLINCLIRHDLYPNVRRRYIYLHQLLKKYHCDKIDLLHYYCSQSGMPDFICFRDGKFKFVECKFNHEQLSKRQKLCILRLQSHGFNVEVLKFVDPSVRMRVMEENHLGMKRIMESQRRLMAY
jgi:DNA polymerase elongation subunit (family B)